jgi:trigger factor
MKLTITKLPACWLELEIEIPAEEFKNFFEKAVLEAGRDLEVQGFRKGKAPKSLVEEKIGSEQILIKAAEMAVEENYCKAVLENSLEVISQPEIKIQKLAKGDSFIFSAKVAVLPEIELPDYKSIAAKAERREVLVEEEEVEDALKWLQKSRAKFTLKNEPAQKGDFVEIEYHSPQIKSAGGQDKINDGFILGQGRFLPGFEENLIGMKAGQTKENIALIVPGGKFNNKSVQNLGPSVQTGREGLKEIFVNVKMKSVQDIELPEINDRFAQSLGKFEKLDDLKKNIKEGLKLEKEQAESQRLREEILEVISRKTKCELPSVLIEREQSQMLENVKKNVLQKVKISWEQYLQNYFSERVEKETKPAEGEISEWVKKREREILDSFRSRAEQNVKKLLIIREISKRENIEVSDGEVLEEVSRILRFYSSPEEARKDLGVDPEELKRYTKERLKNEKTFAFLESLIKN